MFSVDAANRNEPSFFDPLPQSERTDAPGADEPHPGVQSNFGGEVKAEVSDETNASAVAAGTAARPIPLQDAVGPLFANRDIKVAEPHATRVSPALNADAEAGAERTLATADGPGGATVAIAAPNTGETLPDKNLAESRRRRGRLTKPAELKPPSIAPAAERPTYFLTVKQVAKRYAVGVATVWRWTKGDEGFPQPVHLSQGTTRWREPDLIAFETNRETRK